MLNKMEGKKRERQIVEMKSLFFLQVRLRRAEEGHWRWILHEITSLTSFEFGLPFIIAHSERNVTVLRPVRTCRPCFPSRYILIVFKHGTPHTEVIQARFKRLTFHVPNLITYSGRPK